MDTLPEEMLQEIMEYLRYSDLKCFRLVCKKFYDASLTFRIGNRDNFAYGDQIISASCGYKFDNFVKILSTTERNFYHFHFVNTKITASFREFVEKRAKFILSLTIEKCEIMFDTIRFCEIINECSQLKSLTLRRLCLLPRVRVCNCAATISLPALETMDISGIPDDMFNVLMNTNVKNLHLRVNYDRHLNDVIDTRGRLEDLKSVYLLDDCTDAGLIIIADNLNLTTIGIGSCNVTDRGIKYFVEKQRGLQIVDLRELGLITDESFVAIAKNLKDLKELIFYAESDYIQYTFDVLNWIINFTPVRRIEFYGFFGVYGLVTTGGDVPVSKCLRELCLYNVENKTHVTYIAENFLSLTELELMQSRGVTAQTLQLICQNLKNLKKLNLSEYIDHFEYDVPQFTFSANFKNLEELNLSESEWLSDSILESCFKLPSLRILKLGYCKHLTVKSFVAMPKIFPCLEDLDMCGLKVNKHILLSTVSLMKRLYRLKIWVSQRITKHLLHFLYEHSDSLHRVHFSGYTEKLRFIRSRESKTFVDAKLRYSDADILKLL